MQIKIFSRESEKLPIWTIFMKKCDWSLMEDFVMWNFINHIA